MGLLEGNILEAGDDVSGAEYALEEEPLAGWSRVGGGWHGGSL